MKVLKPSIIALSLFAFTAGNPTETPIIGTAIADGGAEKAYRGGTKKAAKKRSRKKANRKKIKKKKAKKRAKRKKSKKRYTSTTSIERTLNAKQRRLYRKYKKLLRRLKKKRALSRKADKQIPKAEKNLKDWQAKEKAPKNNAEARKFNRKTDQLEKNVKHWTETKGNSEKDIKKLKEKIDEVEKKLPKGVVVVKAAPKAKIVAE